MSTSVHQLSRHLHQVPQPGLEQEKQSLEDIKTACLIRSWSILVANKHTVIAMEFLPTKETTYEWNELGLLTCREIEKDRDEGSVIVKHDYTYDAHTRLTYVKVHEYRNGTWTLHRVLQYKYFLEDRFDLTIIPT